MYNFNLQDPLFLPHRKCALSFHLDQGEAVVLTGENGLGKSTLLHKLKQTHFDISFLEQNILDSFYDRKLSQIYHFVMGLRPVHKLRFERLWNDFQLSQKEDRTLSQLSGGEGQALKICLALAKEVPLYFLDEPSQYLDMLKKEILKQHLVKLITEKKSLLIVEHDLDWPPVEWRKISLVNDHETLAIGPSWTT